MRIAAAGHVGVEAGEGLVAIGAQLSVAAQALLQEVVALHGIVGAALKLAKARVVQRDVEGVYALAGANRAGSVAVLRVAADDNARNRVNRIRLRI